MFFYLFELINAAIEGATLWFAGGQASRSSKVLRTPEMVLPADCS